MFLIALVDVAVITELCISAAYRISSPGSSLDQKDRKNFEKSRSMNFQKIYAKIIKKLRSL
jgi:hypothetical protein